MCRYYDVMSRGNARQTVFRDEGDDQRLLDGLAVVGQDRFQVRRSGQLGRDVAAWLARRLSSATLRELAPAFGLSHPDSLNNLVRRVDRALAESSRLRQDIKMTQRILEFSTTDNRA